MTPEQVTRRTGWAYALIAGGIACFYETYEYAKPWVPGTEPAPEFAPYLFGGLGVVCLIAGAVLWFTLKRQSTPPATTDLKSPQGKVVLRLMVAGIIALVATYFVGYVVPEGGGLDLAINGVLLLIVGICFVSAGLIAKKMRAAAAGVAKG
jgi:hypothetical protein